MEHDIHWNTFLVIYSAHTYLVLHYWSAANLVGIHSTNFPETGELVTNTIKYWPEDSSNASCQQPIIHGIGHWTTCHREIISHSYLPVWWSYRGGCIVWKFKLEQWDPKGFVLRVVLRWFGWVQIWKIMKLLFIADCCPKQTNCEQIMFLLKCSPINVLWMPLIIAKNDLLYINWVTI